MTFFSYNLLLSLRQMPGATVTGLARGGFGGLGFLWVDAGGYEGAMRVEDLFVGKLGLR
jgi:hypothetical protein